MLGQFKSQVVPIEFDSHQIFISRLILMEKQTHMETSVLWVTEHDSHVGLPLCRLVKQVEAFRICTQQKRETLQPAVDFISTG